MLNCFEDTYFVKKIHLEAGKIITDHIYNCYCNFVDCTRIELLRHIIVTQKNCTYIFTDCAGACFARLCKYISLHNCDSSIFIIRDDKCTYRPLALYAEKQNTFVLCADRGYSLDSFYLRDIQETELKKYRKLAETHFSSAL